MPHESVRHSAITSGISDLVADVSDLIQKEARLARGELSGALSGVAQAGVRFGAAAYLGILCSLVLVEGIVFAVAAYGGMAMHWACLIVAAILAVAAGILYMRGRAQLPTESNTAPRSVRQWNETMKMAKEPVT
jgi:Putative Actinobacterial Holin-X, holin superfamily III